MLNFNLKSSLIIYLLVICGTTSGNSDLSQENLSMFNHVNKSYQTWLNERQNTGINELDESGGPDDFGYRFIDNNEQNGPEYGWVDISLTGTTIDDMDDDDFEGPIELPWDFSFYGNEYDEIYICSNGFLRFGDGSDEHGNDPIPFGGAPDNIICLFWDDLDPSGGGTIHYGTDEDDRWICQFQQISEFGGENGTITAEIILNEDGSILLQYNSLEGDIDIDGETIGIEDEEGAVGLQVSQDDEPFDYPYENLAILITLEEPDASVSGVISDSETGDPIENVLLVFGDYEAVTDDNGEYAIEQIRAGEYDVRAYVNGYYDYFDREIEFIEGENEYNFTLDPSSFPYGLVGYWTFDNQENLEEAEFGRDLRRAGTVTSITGPDQGDRAVSVGAGSFYRCFHSIPPNGHGNPEKVNQYTLVMDIRIPALNQSYSIYQTDIYNTDDSECLIDGDGHIGTTATGFSIDSLEANEWYRFVVSVDLGGVVNYYLDGQLLQIGEDQEFDGRFALSSQNDDNQVLFFADDNGEDNAIDVAMIVLFSRFLNSREIAGIGGYGHEIEGPEIIHMPVFLQSPTPTSMFVCWHYRYSIESIVRFGPTNALDSVITGTHHRFNANTIWHKVQLTDLEPNTFYYYRCVSDTAESELGRFRTLPEETDESADVRFIVYGCSSSDPEKHTEIIESMKEKVEEESGEDINQYLDLIINVGGIITDSDIFSQYKREYFDPVRTLSSEVPFMVTIGSNEDESNYFYEYMEYDDFAGFDDEQYYSYRVGPVLFISLNSNTQGDTQLAWLQGILTGAENDEDISWVFVFTHHPGLSELHPSNNSDWVRNSITPLLGDYDKTAALIYCNSHGYERGAPADESFRLILTGGGGAPLDRWGMFENQTDYEIINRSYDYNNYVLFDIDCEDGTYSAKSYGLGHPDRLLNSEPFDSFYRDITVELDDPVALRPWREGSDPVFLTCSQTSSGFPIKTSFFQLTDTENDWDRLLVDETMNGVNFFGDSGTPLYTPVDLNAGEYLNRVFVPEGVLELDSTYWWRVKYRDENLQWSGWSETQEFTMALLPDSADFLADVLEGYDPFTVRFTDISVGWVTSMHWDMDDDGLEDSDARDPAWTYRDPGIYTVTLTAFFGDSSDTEIKQNYITVLENNVDPIDNLPSDFHLAQNYPNPFNPLTTIQYILPKSAAVKLSIFNIEGKLVREFIEGFKQAGTHTVNWNGKDINGVEVSSGLYFYRLTAGEYRKTMKAVYLK